MSGSTPGSSASRFERYLRDVPDFPKPGIIFKDITPLLADPAAFEAVIAELCAVVQHLRPSHIAAIESRGFLFGAPMAQQLTLPLIPLRKPGKLPWHTYSESYELEYGTNTLEVHQDAAGPGDRVVLVDDLLATGGTIVASINLVRRLGAEAVAAVFVVELAFLKGRESIHGPEVVSLVRIED